MILIGCAKQSEIIFIGNGKADAPIGILKNITAVMVVKLIDHQMTALHHADFIGVITTDY